MPKTPTLENMTNQHVSEMLPASINHIEIGDQSRGHVCFWTPTEGVRSIGDFHDEILLRYNSAPALLAALKSALKTAKFENHAARPWHEQARHAIALARGK